MKPNFAIGIPTLNRFDLLLPALLYYQHDFPDIRVLISDNGYEVESFRIKTANNILLHLFNNQNSYPLNATMTRNPGVANSWNFLIDTIFNNHDIKYAVILNDDIYWGREQEDFNLFLAEFERTQGMAEGIEKGFILAPTESKYDWCMFVISREAWETIGEFDKNFFPAYFEDCDYKYRAKLAGVTVHNILRGPARFVSSGTVQKDKSLLHDAEKNRAYYVKKWGGEPGKEIYTIPFKGKIHRAHKEKKKPAKKK